MVRLPQIAPLFPYTTLFRSATPSNYWHVYNQYTIRVKDRDALREHLLGRGIPTEVYYPKPLHLQRAFAYNKLRSGRSEEHTSELQSRVDLVCRLLLEKKKNI